MIARKKLFRDNTCIVRNIQNQCASYVASAKNKCTQYTGNSNDVLRCTSTDNHLVGTIQCSILQWHNPVKSEAMTIKVIWVEGEYARKCRHT